MTEVRFDEPAHGVAVNAAGGPGSPARLRQLALAGALLILAIIGVSAYLRLSGADLGCGDWPDCYGRALRERAGGVAPAATGTAVAAVARAVHRLAASTVLVLVLLMCGLCLARRPRPRPETGLAFALLGVTVFLAVLGYAAGPSRVPAVALANLLGGFVMFALCARLASGGSSAGPPRLTLLAILAAAALLAQSALGAWLSASYAVTSCASLSDCLAQAGAARWSDVGFLNEPVLATRAPHNAAGALVQSVHRLWAIVVATFLVLLAAGAARQGRRVAAGALAALVTLEVVLGLRMTGGGAGSLGLALAHNGLAALMLGACLVIARPVRTS